MGRLKDKYVQEAAPKLKEQLGSGNVLRLPRLVKVVVNMGIGIADKDTFKLHVDELAKITGQKPVITRARQSISNFKLRKGMTIGARVTLRGRRMYEFLDRLINAALPRIRDFRGLRRKWRGNRCWSIVLGVSGPCKSSDQSAYCRYNPIGHDVGPPGLVPGKLSPLV